MDTCTTLSRTHVILALGARKLRDLSAEDVDRWLAEKAKTHSTSTLQRLHSCLNRAVKHAMARDKVRRSVRSGGDTRTRKSRRTLALPKRCVDVLRTYQQTQQREREKAGQPWDADGLVFASAAGTPLDSANVRRAFRKVLQAHELGPELRHSFVSLLSVSGVPLEEISRLVGHSSTAVTEPVYRKQIRPVLQGGAVAMDRVFET
ncbi:tyrosine-type recombinase/integrase [Streptosporangium saharense]|uniref:tyrosine-type recombinase/integrase n=1 Tax=Streptosporangium saharense TaxID=1706840 RepID=UPI0034208460